MNDIRILPADFNKIPNAYHVCMHLHTASCAYYAKIRATLQHNTHINNRKISLALCSAHNCHTEPRYQIIDYIYTTAGNRAHQKCRNKKRRNANEAINSGRPIQRSGPHSSALWHHTQAMHPS